MFFDATSPIEQRARHGAIRRTIGLALGLGVGSVGLAVALAAPASAQPAGPTITPVCDTARNNPCQQIEPVRPIVECTLVKCHYWVDGPAWTRDPGPYRTVDLAATVVSERLASSALPALSAGSVRLGG